MNSNLGHKSIWARRIYVQMNKRVHRLVAIAVGYFAAYFKCLLIVLWSPQRTPYTNPDEFHSILILWMRRWLISLFLSQIGWRPIDLAQKKHSHTKTIY